MPVSQGAVRRALPGFKALVSERKSKDGFAWYDESDMAAIRAKDPEFRTAERALMVKYAADELNGVELDRRSDGVRMQALIDLLKATGGNLTDEVRALYGEKYGRVSGPLIKAVRERLGIENPNPKAPRNGKAAAEPPAEVPSDVREALGAVEAVKRLQSRISALDHQIEDLEAEKSKVEADLEHYKPVLQMMNGLSKAVQNLKNAGGPPK